MEWELTNENEESWMGERKKRDGETVWAGVKQEEWDGMGWDGVSISWMKTVKLHIVI